MAWIAIVNAFLPILLSSQTVPLLHFKRIGVEQGLSASWVTSFMQERDGFVWIGTEDGANRRSDAYPQHLHEVAGYLVC